jgi:FkbM family methyltransferase
MSMIADLLRPVSFRGKARVLERFVPRAGVVETTVFGYTISLDLSDHIQRLMYMNAYERRLANVLRSWVRAGMTVLDVGANAGYFTLLAARSVGSLGRVIAVEPSPWVANILGAAIRANDLARRVILERVALGATTGDVTLEAPAPGNHAPSLLEAVRGRPTTVVSIERLDDSLPRWAGDEGIVDVMKVDVEGYEPYLLEGGKTVLAAGRVRRIAIEANAKWLRKTGTSPEGLRRQLEALRFRHVGTLDPGSGNETYLMQHQSLVHSH